MTKLKAEYPKTLKINGALVALYPIGGLKAVAIDVMINAGSWYEGGETWGKAHLLEHMMFQGTESFKNHDDMEIFKEENGIYSNASTGGAQIEVYLRMPGESLENGLKLLEEMLFKLTISEEALLKQKKVVTQEYEDRISRPSARYWQKEMAQTFGKGHLYTRDGIGKKECFGEVSRSELLDYARENIVSNNMVLAVAGNFDVKEVEEKLRLMLKRDKEFARKKFESVKPSLAKLIHLEPGMSTAKVDMKWLTKGLDTVSYEFRLKLWLAAYLLGGSPRSILTKEIRERLGLAYSISVSRSFYPTVGLLEVNTSVKRENVELLVFEVRKLIIKFVEEPIEKVVFERAKKYLILQDQMSYESALGTASNLSSSLFWYGKIRSSEEMEKTLNSISENEVRETLSEIVLSKEPMVSIMQSDSQKAIVEPFK